MPEKPKASTQLGPTDVLSALRISDDWRSIIERLPPGSGKAIRQQLDALEAAYENQEWTLTVALVHLGRRARLNAKSPYRVRVEPRLPPLVVADE